MSLFGMLLDALRSHGKALAALMFAVLAALVVANVFVRPEEAEYVLDAYPAFWPAFGLVVGLAMVIVMKKIVQPMISRRDDYYERD